MSHVPLLLEIGCEEIPARMIAGATSELRDRVVAILDQAGLKHGAAAAWGGTRRLAVRVEEVEARQDDRSELMLGPPAKVAFDKDGKPTPAAVGFAKKQGIDPAELRLVEASKGTYAGFTRDVRGLTVGEVLAAELPRAVEGMSFPKTMRWAEGRVRWVRPVHWLLALHGRDPLEIDLFGVRGAARSEGHRFLAPGPVDIAHPDDYRQSLERAFVVIDPSRRRELLSGMLVEAAATVDGRPIEDPALLEEIADLVEWPAVVTGGFDDKYLALPREILVTTLRYHQKCFSVQNKKGKTLAAFLAVANTDRDPAGHIRRGNEWVVGGRLEDAEFFWDEDTKSPFEAYGEELAGVAFHAKSGSYADKTERIVALAQSLASRVSDDDEVAVAAGRAASMAKNDLVTRTVGEFPELQGVAGGLMLRAEGAPEAVARAVYEHYRPSGPDDDAPSTEAGAAVSAADKLDSVARLVEAGEAPTGSRDPFGLRRAANGLFRVVIERRWPLSLSQLVEAGGADPAEPVLVFLRERLENFLRERGYTAHEVRSVTQAAGGAAFVEWPLPDVRARLDAIRGVRDREDFRRLVELTKRVGNILRKNDELAQKALGAKKAGYDDPEPAVGEIERMIETLGPEIERHSSDHEYEAVVDRLAGMVEPVDAFFVKALVIDPDNADATSHRLRVLARTRDLLTRYFDISELSGEADRRDACPS